MVSNWSLSGTYFESCNCETLCPCILLSPPTEGECTVLLGWHVDRGRFGDVELDGLNVSMAVHSPGKMHEVQWTVALYVDARANEYQLDALTQINAGQAGGHLERIAQHVETPLGVKSVEIDYRVDGKKRSLVIPNIAETAFTAIEGQGGAEVTITNHPLAVAPGHTATVARSEKLVFNDYAFNWELTNKNAFYSDFTYEGP